jgi:ABC-type nitrate/sulfonate/bicarbonate transport system substrate-binding protein
LPLLPERSYYGAKRGITAATEGETMAGSLSRRSALFGLAVAAGSGLRPGTARAADKVRVGKAAANAWTFSTLEVGKQVGIFAKDGLDVEIVALAGDAKLQQAMAADSLDFALGSGPSMAFSVKGSPVIAVAAFAGPPLNLSVVVGADSPIKTVTDLKGKTLSVTTKGSLTEWLAKRLSIAQGWGPDGVKTVALGAFQSSLAALRTHEIDGMMTALESGYMLEEKHAGRVVTDMGPFAPHFITHVVFARKALVASDPALVRRFLKGFFATIAFMKANRDKTIAITSAVLGQSAASIAKTYDYEISMFIDDGSFDPAAVKTLKDSFVEMGTLDKRPPDDAIFTTAFVPVKP